jgi:ABC-type antimicrobial peptide transport system permease subunit
VAASALAEPRFTTLLLAGFAIVALLLAAIGLYGLITFVTARRTREIGVRMALGARATSVGLLVVGDCLGLAAAGVALGLLASFWATRLLSSELYGISRLDPVTLVAAPAILFTVALAASFLPAWRAVRTNPLAALRRE